MVYLDSVNNYLHQSSLLVSAYPETVRITTKYTLPRSTPAPERPPPANRISKSKSEKVESVKKERKPRPTKDGETPAGEKKEPKPIIASLTFKTFEPSSGICLKYTTDKQAEVGRLMLGLGKLAAGEVIEEATTQPAVAAEDKMDIDGEAPAKEEPQQPPAAATATGGGGKKKKKGKK